MNRSIRSAAAVSALAVLLTGCADKAPAPADIPSEASPSAESEVFDLARIADASRMSLLIEKYSCIGVNYEMDYGETYEQKMTFFRNKDGGLSYIGMFGSDCEYYDGKYDYWQESSEDGISCYAYFGVAGADTSMDLDSYIFSYTAEDDLRADGLTRSDDGGFIISASETIPDSYTDDSGEIVSHTYDYEYMISANADLELTELICTCTDSDTGEVDSRLDMKVDYSAKQPTLPSFMDETFVVDTITVKPDGSEITETFDIPVGFMPYFVTPPDSEYIFSYDREGTRPIDDTLTISSPCTVYILAQSSVSAPE